LLLDHSQFSFPLLCSSHQKKKVALRRMKLEELIFKMEQIEEQAALTLHEYPKGHTRERQRLVMAIAKQVRSHLLDQLEAGVRDSLAGEGEVRVGVVDDGAAEPARVAALQLRSIPPAEK
jgi:hypothetical protein